jgi:hypothetical protein
VESVTAPLSYDALATTQDNDDWLEHSWRQSPHCGSRHYQSPAPRSPSTATRLPGDLDRTF